MSKSREVLEKISCRYVNDQQFQEWCSIINQDLELKDKYLNELKRWGYPETPIHISKYKALEKENKELIINKNVAQAVAFDQKREIGELKDRVAYLKEDGEEWQSAYEWSQAQNAILKLKNQELKEIIKANFFYHKNSEEIGYRKPMPKYQDKIKDVLEDE